MPDTYNIYLVNNSSNPQIFWCFLARPEELVNDPKVFANSSTNLSVNPNQPGANLFTIPVQYVLGAGASNNAVAPYIEINSSVTSNASLTDEWEAKYYDVPPTHGPTMSKVGSNSRPGTLSIESTPFNQPVNEAYGWFASMSFGIQTKEGFMGMTWSPAPNTRRTLTPKLQFYVSTGTYGSNTLADWNDVSRGSALISVPGSFDIRGNTTVTYTASGEWIVTPGQPPQPQLRATVDELVQSNLYLSKAHAELVAISANDISL